MPNHFHLEILPRSLSVPEIMRSVKGYTAKRINGINNSEGKIWQDGYFDFPMDKLDAILAKKNYIEMNPVRANIVENPSDYPFSSAGIDDLYDLACLFQ
jgi:putative transposase